MFIIFVIGFVFWLICFAFWKKNKDKKSNDYVEYHKKKLDDDLKYEYYLHWCSKNGEVPLDKKEWGSISVKEKKINELLK